MQNLKLSLHHVGGRGGSRTFPVPEIFEKDLINILYDADDRSHSGIKDYYKNKESDTHVLPYALSDKCKTILFNINKDPNTNSVFETNNDYHLFYRNYPHLDYLVKEAYETEEKKKMDFVSFDFLYKEKKITQPKPDFISLITGSSEYDILKGANETLTENILGINCEVHLHSFRNGQKNFSDLQKYLDEKGFYFVNFFTPYRYSEDKIDIQSFSPFRYPLGLRGDGFDVVVHVLFLRKIEEIENLTLDPYTRYIHYRKLSFISLLFNQTEYGLECLKYSNKYQIEKNILHEKYIYLNFLDEIKVAENNHAKIYPKTFNEFNKTNIKKELKFEKKIEKNIIKSLIKKIPFAAVLFRFLASFFKLERKNENTKFEKVFIKYGLINQANLIMKKRINSLHK